MANINHFRVRVDSLIFDSFLYLVSFDSPVSGGQDSERSCNYEVANITDKYQGVVQNCLKIPGCGLYKIRFVKTIKNIYYINHPAKLSHNKPYNFASGGDNSGFSIEAID